MKILLNLLTSTLAIIAATYLLPHVKVDNVFYAILLAFVLAALNSLIKPLLILLTLPATILSFGIFLLVINAAIILLADYLIDGFKVDGFWWALLFSIVLSIITGLLNSLINPEKEKPEQY